MGSSAQCAPNMRQVPKEKKKERKRKRKKKRKKEKKRKKKGEKKTIYNHPNFTDIGI